MDRTYGRPKQAVDVNTGIDTACPRAWSACRANRVILEELKIRVERAQPHEA